ncbi:HesB/YadR/YfhF family protein [Cytobacillus sp. Hz8]|uniref:HesB/YadR/YfhF family protein n=1 Tax=Cytobacillus sp. Hz8 TaxID=3347168 RepID=UPI0035D568F4
MNIHITEEAANWYIEELDLKNGDYVRFFARYGGHSTVHQGFSLGISTETPHNMGVQTSVNGVIFYIEDADLWYFDGHDIMIDFNSKIGEPEISFNK